MHINKKKLLLKDLPSIRQMLAFVTVYKFGHMSAAAEELALTQPAVTVLIRELENKLGVKLFDRATRSLKPTVAADEIMPFILRALNELDNLNQHMKDYTALNIGSLTLAVTPNSSQSLLPLMLGRFRIQHPHVRINILECEPLQLIPALLKEKADLALGSFDKSLPSLTAYKVLEDKIVAICKAGSLNIHPLKHWQDLAKQTLILTKIGYGIRPLLDQLFIEKNIHNIINITHEVSLISTVIALAKSGLGIGLVPYSAIDATDNQLDIYELNDPEIHRSISLIHLKDKNLSPSASAFLTLHTHS